MPMVIALSGQHRVGPHGEAVPGPFLNGQLVGLNPGQAFPRRIFAEENHGMHFDSMFADGALPGGGRTRIFIDLFHTTSSVVPEPDIATLLGIGGFGLLVFTRRRFRG
jgi:hypothetical protein